MQYDPVTANYDIIDYLKKINMTPWDVSKENNVGWNLDYIIW